VRLQIIAVGHRMPDWVDAAFSDYARRLPREMPLQLKALKPAPRPAGGGDTGRCLDIEAARIEESIPAGAFRVVLDERGRSLATRELAASLGRWRGEGHDLVFVIGGADGLAARIKQGAGLLWSLSPLTLPHGLVRVILAEQLYRASSLLAGHPYHRD
jgi:23S rRNA (pseudouridine1915-N3)-methyltransferase